MSIEADNAAEEIKEIIDKCTNCGMCKSFCPIVKALCEETLGPRGKINLLNKDVYDKLFYQCSLCKVCEERCAQNIKICEALRKARVVLANSGKETKENKEMIKNIREFGNPFGKEKAKQDKLYCC